MGYGVKNRILVKYMMDLVYFNSYILHLITADRGIISQVKK